MPGSDEIKVHSFDVFDTCITRSYANPRDVFYVLGHKISPSHLNEDARHKFARRFQKARIRAEKIVNFLAKWNGSVRTNIFSIYEVLRYLFKTGMSVKELVQVEIDLECECIYPVPEIVEKMDCIRTSGGRIVLISDMYIPGDLLAPILQHHGILKDGDVLYVSCDYGKSKSSGGLFTQVLLSEKINSKEMLHVGDNAHADILMANKNDIRAEHFNAAHLSRYEKLICEAGSRFDVNKSWVAAFSRRCRLSVHNEVALHEDFSGVVQSVIIPFLLAYVIWIIEHAKINGIKRLYFVARDGEILYKIARELCIADEGIEPRYLHGSRRAWLAPSIGQDSLDWQRLLIVAGNRNSPADIVDRLGLDEYEKDQVRGMLSLNLNEWHRIMDLESANIFSTNLLGNHGVAEIIKKATENKRETMRLYLEKMGLFDDSAWALVDAGWSLNSQAALKRVLNSYRSGSAPKGYYIGLSKDHLSEEKAGQSFAFIQKSGALLSRRRVIVEHCFLPSTHASTIGYQVLDGEVVPVLGEEIRSNEEILYARALHEAGIACARLVAKERSIYNEIAISKSAILALVSDFVSMPDKNDVNFFTRFGVITEMRHEKSFISPLCKVLDWNDIISIVLMTLSNRRTFFSTGYMWLEGSAAISPLHIRLVVKAMLWTDSIKNKINDRS